MVASIGRTVMHHVPRAVVPWVLLEVYHTLANDAHFTVVMSNEQRANFEAALCSPMTSAP